MTDAFFYGLNLRMENGELRNAQYIQESHIRATKEMRAQEIKKEEEPDGPLVEDIARAKAEIIKKLFIERAPADQWQNASREILSRYPQLHDYEPFFHCIVAEALERHERVEELCQGVEIVVDKPKMPIGFQLDRIGDASAKKLFEDVFDLSPEGVVDAVRGNFSVTFYVDTKDARSAYENISRNQPQEETPLGFAGYSRDGVPVLVCRRDGDVWQQMVTVIHEAEHIKNRILREGREATFGKLPPGSETLRKLREWDYREAPMEESAKDEILAVLSQLQAYEGALPESEAGKTNEIAQDFFEKAEEAVKKAISESGGYYYKEYYAEHYPTEQELQRYRKSTAESIRAYARLWRLYANSGKFDRKEVAHMASNVLEQFPLSKWPAATRLIEAQYGNKPVDEIVPK